MNTLMIVSGGRDKNIQETLITDVYDTETSEWRKFSAIGLFRHSCFVKDSSLFIYGGFENKSPNVPIQSLYRIELISLFSSSQTLLNKINSMYSSSREGLTNQNNQGNNNIQSNTSQIGNNSNTISITGGKFIPTNNGLVNNTTNYISNNNNFQYVNYSILNQLLEKDSSKSGLMDNNNKNQTFLLSNQAVIIQATEDLDDINSIMRKVDIDKLNQESKRIGPEYMRFKIQQKRVYNEEVINKFIDVLFHPFDWQNQKEMEAIHNQLPFSKEEVDTLLKDAAQLIHKEKTLINIRSPAKIFGNLFGQYYDLMRFFEAYGNPSDVNPMGDINITTYIFLGDYCDRGHYSLEVILLLFALKVKYPESVLLLRGHHEDENVNKRLGLLEDCERRMSDPLLFSKINAIFDILPLACVIDNKILCCHGGIGSRLNSLSDISKIQRPISIFQDVKTIEQQILIDLLYSEYSEDTTELASNEERDISKLGFITKFGKERLSKFLNDNGLSLLITSHSWVTEGVKA
ncbi:MAG: metallophosphoesterase, partial [bacterium]